MEYSISWEGPTGLPLLPIYQTRYYEPGPLKRHHHSFRFAQVCNEKGPYTHHKQTASPPQDVLNQVH